MISFLWNSVLIVLLFILCILLYYFFNNFYEIFWKINYLLLSYSITFLLFFVFSEDLLFMYLENIGKLIIIHDPQEYIYFFFNISFLISFILIFLNIVTYFSFFFIEILTKEEYIFYKIILSYLLYVYFLLQWLFFEDFIFFHWEIFLSMKRLIFDFQPDLLNVYWYYKKEYLDLWCWIIIFIIFKLIFYVQYFQNFIKRNIYIYLLFSFAMLILLIYLFGGETFYRDFLLLFFSIILGELFKFIILFFKTIHSFG